MRSIGHIRRRRGWNAAVGLTTLLWLLPVLLLIGTSQATLKHKRQTGKKCLCCHSRVPHNGAKDLLLSAQGCGWWVVQMVLMQGDIALRRNFKAQISNLNRAFNRVQHAGKAGRRPKRGSGRGAANWSV